MLKPTSMATTVSMMSAESPSSATNKAFTESAVTAAVSGQKGIQLYMDGPAPDGDEDCKRRETGRDIRQHEGGQHGHGKAPEWGALDVAEQQDALDRADRPVLLRVGEGVDQLLARDGDAFDVTADIAVGRGD